MNKKFFLFFLVAFIVVQYVSAQSVRDYAHGLEADIGYMGSGTSDQAKKIADSLYGTPGDPRLRYVSKIGKLTTAQTDLINECLDLYDLAEGDIYAIVMSKNRQFYYSIIVRIDEYKNGTFYWSWYDVGQYKL